MTRCVFTALATLAFTFQAAGPSAQAVRAYRVEPIGGNSPFGFAINKGGDIAGCEIMPDGTLHAFRWRRRVTRQSSCGGSARPRRPRRA